MITISIALVDVIFSTTNRPLITKLMITTNPRVSSLSPFFLTQSFFVDRAESAGPQGRFALVGGKAIKIEPGTQLNTIATYPPPPQPTTTLPIPQTNLRAIPTANLTNKPVPQLHQATPMGAFNIRITKDLLAGPNRAQQQTQAWLTNNTGIILSPSLTIRQIGEVRTVPTAVHQIPTTGTITQQGYLVPQVWRSASFKSTSKPTVMPTLVTKKRTSVGVAQFAPPVAERKETTSNDLEQFTATEDRYDSDEEDSDAERVLGHSEDEDDEDDPNVTVDDDYKPPYSVKAKSRGQSSRHNSSGGSDSKKEDTENSKDIKYVEGKDKPWVCKNCHRMYKWKNSLKCHLKNECGLPPKYFCSRDCGYKTNVHSNLKRHLNSKFCKSRDPPPEETSTPADQDETMLEQNPLLTVIKEEPL